MSAHTSSRRSRSARRNGGPPSSTRAPRAARPQVGGGRPTTPPGPGPPARTAPRHRASSAVPRARVTSWLSPSPGVPWPRGWIRTSCPWARAQAGRWTWRWGSRPLTTSVAPGVRPARARSSRTWAPRSKPRSSRSIVGSSGDRPLPVIESEVVDRRFESGVPAGAPVLPLLETLEVEEGPDVGVAVVHGQQQLPEPGEDGLRAGVGDRHVAVVVGAGLGEDPGGPRGQRPLPGEQQVVGVDHAGGVDLAGGQGPGGVALPADVIAVQSHADVEPPDLEVLAGIEAELVQVVKGQERRLGGVDRPRPHDPAPETL